MRPLLVLALLLWPLSALSDSYPALFDVRGVAANDTLNIRTEPRASADKIGEFPANATDIEVIRTENGWALVNVAEHSGWTSLRYLKRQETGDYALTRHLTCFGTEPFWSLDIEQGTNMRLHLIGEAPQMFGAGLVHRSDNRPDRLSIRGQGAGTIAAVIARRACNDGMSDRQFGLDIDLLVDDRQLSGCCSLTGN